jgi:hypothetical protein
VVGEEPHGQGPLVSSLVHCQTVVERMLRDGRSLAEVEEYIDRSALDQMEKAGLWMLAWAHQDEVTQLRLAKEMLALVTSINTTEDSRSADPAMPRPGL